MFPNLWLLITYTSEVDQAQENWKLVWFMMILLDKILQNANLNSFTVISRYFLLNGIFGGLNFYGTGPLVIAFMKMDYNE